MPRMSQEEADRIAEKEIQETIDDMSPGRKSKLDEIISKILERGITGEGLVQDILMKCEKLDRKLADEDRDIYVLSEITHYLENVLYTFAHEKIANKD